MSEETQIPPTVTLDIAKGHEEYLTSMRSILEKVDAIRGPGDPEPRVLANMMIAETSRFFASMLPNIDLREIASFFGAVLGMELGGWVAEGQFTEEEARDAMTAIVYASCAESLPRAAALVAQAQKQGMIKEVK